MILINFFLFFLNNCPEITDNKRAFYNENINLLNCIFNRMIITGNGGAILIDNAPCNLNLENTNFFECKCTEKGGAIYFENGQNMKMDKVCAILCMSQFGQFGSFEFLTNSDSIFSFLTVTKCADNFDFGSPIYSRNGNLKFQNLNSSHNYCSGYSIMSFDYIKSFLIQFSNFYGNQDVGEYGSFYSFEGENSQVFEYSNIISNKGNILLYFNLRGSNFYLRYLIIQYNMGTYLFQQKSYLYHLYILGCVIIHSGSLTSGTFISLSPSFQNIYTNTYSLVHYQTQFEINNNKIQCIAENPIPDRTPFITPKLTPIYTPKETPIKTPQITTPLNTPQISPQYTTPQISRTQTLHETPIQTPLISTPIPTPQLSPIPTTLLRTPIITPIETLSISRSPTLILTQTNQLNQEDNSIFSSPFFYISLNLIFLIIILIIIIIFLNNKLNKKESSSSKKEKKKKIINQNIINNDIISTNPYSQIENQFGIQKNLI